MLILADVTENSAAAPADPFESKFVTGTSGDIIVASRGKGGKYTEHLRVKVSKNARKPKHTCTDVRFHNNTQAVVMCGDSKAVVDLGTPGSADTLGSSRLRWHMGEHGNNEHAVELIPGPYMVSASSGGRGYGLEVRKLHADGSATLVQTCSLASGHALKWDRKRNLLWALGSSVFPQTWEYRDPKEKLDPYWTCEESEHVYGVLCAYPLREGHERPLGHPMVFPLPDSQELPESENPKHGNYGWREGPHDFAPLPRQDKFLVSTDMHSFVFDIGEAMRLGASSKAEMKKLFVPAEQSLLEGFKSPMEFDEFKAVSIHSNGDVLICQARMVPPGLETAQVETEYTPDYVSSWLTVFRPSTKEHYYLKPPAYTYKARWHEEPAGWEGITLPS
ncbi:hypothetical protein [Streptomyces sp. NPDC091371]|uniref:hypothetical protein n=1 Tax=Streptomyces sp. NPDC091371 TaxID=3155303 RepID=UPI003413B8E6